jgi:hypothetical protein
LIGGRYGSEISETRGKTASKTFYDRYESITKREYASAMARTIPAYILIERSVYAEYHTYQNNRANKSVTYAHVDSINVFGFIDEILSQPFNNPVQTFEKFSDVESWLREQWAGLFRDLLNRRSEQHQLSSLSSEVKQLSELNTTLKRYLETLLLKTTSNVDESSKVIQQEDQRLDKARMLRAIEANPLIDFLGDTAKKSTDKMIEVLANTTDFESFLVAVLGSKDNPVAKNLLPDQVARDFYSSAKNALNDASAEPRLPKQ